MNYPGGWFGASWDAPVCDEARHRETPVGEPCLECGAPIESQDQGMLIPYVGKATAEVYAWHLKCFLHTVLGPNWLEQT